MYLSPTTRRKHRNPPNLAGAGISVWRWERERNKKGEERTTTKKIKKGCVSDGLANGCLQVEEEARPALPVGGSSLLCWSILRGGAWERHWVLMQRLSGYTLHLGLELLLGGSRMFFLQVPCNLLMNKTPLSPEHCKEGLIPQNQPPSPPWTSDVEP